MGQGSSVAGSLVAAVVLVGAGLASPSYASGSQVARWEMDERAGVTTMRDTSGQNHNGTVGDDVTTGDVVDGATGYRFPTVSPDELPYRPEHVVQVPDARALDPGDSTYVVEVRLRPSGPDGNVVQKGQSRTAGGYWKIELNDGRATCLFRGPGGVTNAVRQRSGSLVDSRWHTVRCVRTPDAVELWVDGAHVGRNTGDTGPIANSSPVSIGGKSACDQVQVGCDYYSGRIDSIRISTS